MPIKDSSGWTVSVDGDASHDMQVCHIGDTSFPIIDGINIDSLEGVLARLERRDPQPGDAKKYGRWLFDCLLAPVWQGIRNRNDVAAARGLEVALCWPTDQLALHALIWEAMHDGSSTLAGHPELLVAITRLVPVDLEKPKLISQPRMLLAIGSSLDDEVIASGTMQMGLLRAFESTGLCTTWFETDISVKELQDACNSFRPHIVHVVAHGAIDQGRCVLTLGKRKADGGDVNADQLLPAITGHGELAMALISACRSGAGSPADHTLPLATELVAGGVPIVVAMTGDISEQSCRLYTKRMIDAIQNGLSVIEAAAKGRRAALAANPEPGEHLDWAMPALLLAQSLPSDLTLFDASLTKLVVDLADTFQIRHSPVFIGRRRALQHSEHLFVADRTGRGPFGFVAAIHSGPLTNLGGTRLLREMAYRLLKQGHIPLFLGPYQSGHAPTDLRKFVDHVLTRVLLFANALGIHAPALSTLGFPADDKPGSDYTLGYDLLAKFRADKGILDPLTIRSMLQDDLNALADVVGKTGPPFSSDTRPVLLGDQAHTWLSMLDILIELAGANGLGTSAKRIPVIMTSSTTEDNGGAIERLVGKFDGQPGYAFPSLDRLESIEAMIGFQWVLLNPWRPEHFVYASARAAAKQQIKPWFQLLKGYPAAVGAELYDIADALVEAELFVKANDKSDYDAQTRRWL